MAAYMRGLYRFGSFTLQYKVWKGLVCLLASVVLFNDDVVNAKAFVIDGTTCGSLHTVQLQDGEWVVTKGLRCWTFSSKVTPQMWLLQTVP